MRSDSLQSNNNSDAQSPASVVLKRNDKRRSITIIPKTQIIYSGQLPDLSPNASPYLNRKPSINSRNSEAK
jgi:hypothetical protein